MSTCKVVVSLWAGSLPLSLSGACNEQSLLLCWGKSQAQSAGRLIAQPAEDVSLFISKTHSGESGAATKDMDSGFKCEQEKRVASMLS